MISQYTETNRIINPDGTEKITVTEKTTNITKCNEPDYIKLYTNVWCEFNQIPLTYRPLFFELICKMSYCNSSDIQNSQIVYVGEPYASDIMNRLHWKRAMLQKGLKALTECNAIKKIRRGVYQINPYYASKGEWKYNPRLDRGGVEDLVAIFNFKDRTVNTKIIWADNGADDEINQLFRDGMGVSKRDETVLKSTDII